MLGPEQGTLTSFPIHVATSPVTHSRGSRGSGCNKGGRNAMSDLNRHALDAAHPTCHNTLPPPLPYRRRCRRNKRVFSHIVRNILLAFGTTVASIINIIYVISTQLPSKLPPVVLPEKESGYVITASVTYYCILLQSEVIEYFISFPSYNC